METAFFDRFAIELSRDDAFYGFHPGDCTETIEALLTASYISEQLSSLDPAAIRDELAEYGAWSGEELSDPEANLTRILWLACGQIYDNLNMQ